MAQIRLLLGAAEALALLCLILVLAGFVVGVSPGQGALSLAVRDPLRLALLIRGSLCLRLGLGFGSLLCLFAFDLGVFGVIPCVEDLGP